MSPQKKKSKVAVAREKMYHDLLVECAERIFAEHGYEKATMQDVAAEAGISLRTLYATFPGKRQLYREVHNVRGREFFEHVFASLQDAPTPMAMLEHVVRSFVDFLLAHRDYFRINLRDGRSWGLAPNLEHREEWREAVKIWADFLRQGIDDGVFYDDDPELMTATGIAILQVQLAGLLADGKDADAEEISARLFLRLQRFFCKPDVLETSRAAAVG